MRWQKIARLAIALFVVGFATVVFLAMRQRPVSPGGNDVDRADPSAMLESGAGNREAYKFGKLDFDLKYEKALTYKDGRTVFFGVTLTVPDRNGRTFVVTADEAEMVAPPERPDDLSVAKLSKNVKLKTDNGMEVLAGEATFDNREGILKVPGPVTFSRGRMKGEGVGATYDRNRDVLWLLADARLTVAPDATGTGTVDASASSAGLARSDNYVKLVGAARLTADTRTTEADEITVLLDEKGEKIQQLQLREKSRITGSDAGAQQLSARHIDMGYAADGRTLQSSKLMEGGVIEMPGPAGAAKRRIAATTIDLVMSPDGTAVTSLTAVEKVQVNLPAEGNGPAREIRSATLNASGPPEGLQRFGFEGSVDFTELRVSNGKPAVDRHVKSERLVIETKPGLGAVERADFRGHTHFESGDVKADAPRAIYDIERDQLDLSPGDKDAGRGPMLDTAQLNVQAINIQVSPSTEKLKADTDVRTVIKPQKPAPTGARGQQGKGAAPATPGQTRVPVMLKQNELVNVTSNRLEYDGVSQATYNGKALLWQGKSRVAADTIVLDDRSGNLTATIDVRTTMLLEDEDPQTKERKLTESRATADMLVYDDAKRLATYTASGPTPASLTSLQGDMKGNRIDLFLRESGSEVDRAVLDGNVSVTLDTLFSTGRHLVYTAATDTYVLTGDPVISVQKDAQGTCKETRGTTMTYERTTDRIRNVGMSRIAGFETKPLPSCPAELRR